MSRLTRDIDIDVNESKDYVFSICSNVPYERSNKEFGTYDEVLTISEDSIDFTRLNSGACAVLKDHDMEKVLGVITKAWIDGNKVKVKVKFSDREEVQGYVKDIENGIMTCTSVGYEITDYHFEKINQKKTMIVDKFSIFEASLVGVPADITVGYQRSLQNNKEIDDMKKEELNEITSEVVEDTEITSEEEIKEEDVETNEVVDEALEATTDEEKGCEEEDLEETKEEEEEIEQLGELTNQKALAKKFISEHRSLKEFKKTIKKLNNKLNVKERKMEKYSLRKALLNCVSGNRYNPNTLEAKVNDQLRTKFQMENADIVLVNKRTIDGSEALNQTEYRPDMYAGVLRPESTIAKVGATYTPVTGRDISFAVATSGCAGGFVDLNGNVPSATMTFSQVTLAPKKFGAWIEISYKSLLQDDPEIESIVVDDINKGVDEIRDKGFIIGSGSNGEPTGVYNATGINQVTSPATWTLSTAYAFEKPIRDANDFSQDLKWVMNSQMYYKLACTPKSATEQNEFLIGDDHKMIGYDCIIDNHLPTSGIMLGNFAEAIIADFEPVSLTIVREDATLAIKQAVDVIAHGAFNVAVRRPSSFTKGK